MNNPSIPLELKRSCCATCPAAMWCLTGSVFVSECTFCYTAVCICGADAQDDCGLTVTYRGKALELFVVASEWEKWKKRRLVGVGFKEVPAPRLCHLVHGELSIMRGRNNVCKICFAKIEEVLYLKNSVGADPLGVFVLIEDTKWGEAKNVSVSVEYP